MKRRRSPGPIGAVVLSIFLFGPFAAIAANLTIPVPGRVRDLSRAARSRTDLGDRSGAAARHFLVKLAAPLDAAMLRRLRAGGIVVTTPLSSDSAVVVASSLPWSSPDVAWAGFLVPEDKAPAEILRSAEGALPAISLLGHPGSTVASLEKAASLSGLRARGGYDSPFGARVEIAAGGQPAAVLRLLGDDEVFAAFVRERPRLANDRSIGTIQSGSPGGPTPAFDHGIFGVGETIAILDTGLDVDSCYFSDEGEKFPVNSADEAGLGTVVGHDHRKIAAYDFLHSCALFPAPCDDSSNPFAYDDNGHGTHVAGNALGDNFAHLLLHDPADGMAPGARVIVQDGGWASSGECGDLPGLGCSAGGVEPILEQAYVQGARIHSDSWADETDGPAPAGSGYPLDARDIDDFVFRHPDFLPVFVAGNRGADGPGSVLAPGTAKNVLCVGSTRNSPGDSDENLSSFSGVGPAADGRIKPDVVAPGVNVSASSDYSILTGNCGAFAGAGTSYAAPTAAGAAALVREYFASGYYPGGEPSAIRGFSPSAALVKAMLVASGDSLQGTRLGVPVDPSPSNQQGFGRVDLSNVLEFPGAEFHLVVVDRRAAFSPDDAVPFRISVRVASDTRPLRVVLVWSDPPGVPRSYLDASPELLDDLDLSLHLPDGSAIAGNVALPTDVRDVSGFDRINNVETIVLAAPRPGDYELVVAPHRVAVGPAVGFAVVAAGDLAAAGQSAAALGAAAARLVQDPDGDGRLGNCEDAVAEILLVNPDVVASPPATVLIESLDSAVEVVEPMPISLGAVPGGGEAAVRFEVRAGFGGIPLACGQNVPFRVTIRAAEGEESFSSVALPAPSEGPGCGDVASVVCAPSQVRPFRPH